MQLAYEMRTTPKAGSLMGTQRPETGAAELRDDAVLTAAQSGDTGAFETLYHRHVGRVYALCLRMAGNAREAEELTQDVFVRAWERLAQFEGRSAFGSWLHRLAVNVVLSTWRSRGRRRGRVVAIDDAVDGADSGHPILDPGYRPRPRHAIDLERAIAQLPVGARTVFVMHDIAGYKHREIAEETGLAIGTTKAQLHRARRLLREALKS